MANTEKQKIVTKKHMARQEREALQVRYLTYGTIVLLVIVAILAGYALVSAYIIIPNKPVATVNGVDITAKEYQTRVKFERYQLVSQMINTANLMASFGGDENTQSYFASSLQQIRFQLTPEIHGQTVLDTMIDNELIRQEAERLGITVSEDEIDKYLSEAFGFFPDGTPTPAPTSEPIPTATLNAQQLTLVAPAATEVMSNTTDITSTEGTEIDPTPTQDLQAEPTEAPPTATPYTEEAFNQDYETAIQNYQQFVGISEKDFRGMIEMDILREKVSEETTKDVPVEQSQIWARHILVETEDEALDVIARLEAGEDFATLAQEVSLDTGSGANGGDLGWFGPGQMVPEFEAAAFALEDGEISQPVESQFGWHVIQKLGYRIQPANENTFEQIKQTFFDTWLTDQRNASEIETSDDWLSIYPETPAIPDGL
jgi:parvulin-like peptidyl-prolyl isomerase